MLFRSAVVAEIDSRLADHELIKVKIRAGSREARNAISGDICERTGAELVQQVGGVALLLRRSKQPDPKLSNLIRRL